MKSEVGDGLNQGLDTFLYDALVKQLAASVSAGAGATLPRLTAPRAPL